MTMTSPTLIDLGPHFASGAQEVFIADVRVFDKQTQREGVYLGHLYGWGDVAVVRFDGDTDATECSFNDIRNLYR